jgi:hypothetical protein
MQLKAIAGAKQREKESNQIKVSKLGFPTQKQNNNTIDMAQLQPANRGSLQKPDFLPKKYSDNEHRNGINRKTKVEIPPAID